VGRLDELLDRAAPDAQVPMDAGAWVPAVFDVAQAGDAAALAILRQAGQELGVATRLVAGRLFAPQQAFALVLGGRVLAHGRCDAMRDALVQEVKAHFPRANPIRLQADPVLGAALLALDRVAPRVDTVSAMRAAEGALAAKGAQ